MDISKIDKNFAVGEFHDDGDMRYYAIPCEPFDLYGVYYEKETKRFVRMPSKIADKVNDGVKILNANTAGGRLRFSTNTRNFSIKVTYSALCEMSHMPLTGIAGFVLLEETENGYRHINTFFPRHAVYDETMKTGYCISCNVEDLTGDPCGETMRKYILFFPLYNDVSGLEIGLDKTATVSHGASYGDKKPILYYGSSITQGGCASRPDNCYQAIISKRNNIDFINLGFSGNGKAEKIMCEYLSGIDCSVFVCDYDHNAPNPEHLKNTHFALYKTFREKQPTTPVVFISKPDIEHDLRCPERFGIIKETFDRARAAGDKNVYLIDGQKFFEGFDRNACTVDGCHPNDLGFYKMAEIIGAQIERILSNKK